MASRFFGPSAPLRTRFATVCFLRSGPALLAVISSLLALPCGAQVILKPSEPGDLVNLMPTDLATLEDDDVRKDLPCNVTERKPELGFDLRFHSGYDVTVPLRELSGEGNMLTVLFRVYPENDRSHASFFMQHIKVPEIDEEAKGDAVLQGSLDIGEGHYHVDWLMRDRTERICSADWDVDATLGSKERPIPLFLKPNDVAQTAPEPFFNDAFVRTSLLNSEKLNVKLLVNFAPQLQSSSSLQRSDIDALVTILKTIERDPHVAQVSLVAFNMNESRVVYRQDAAEEIDFPALGKALESMKLGTVNILKLNDKHSEADFLQELIQKELASSARPDAVIFAGPKAMLNADVPQDELRRIGEIECPVFYLNYNLDPVAVPWKDSISHAIRVFKGTEYTISRPRDLWFSTSEVVSRILRSKRERSILPTATGSGGASQALH